jgi:SAM-dependent methyltransferase
MGIRQYELNVLNEIMIQEKMVFHGLKMLQLGDQVCRGKKISGKKYFENLGSEVTSIDINGKNGSLPIDLSKLINWIERKDYFDIITNFGTSEHVSDHLTCFKNMYYFCRKGGIIFNLVPRKGFWNCRSHRNVHKYDTDFFEKWAKDNSCDILVNKIVKKEERFCDDMVLAVLKRI